MILTSLPIGILRSSTSALIGTCISFAIYKFINFLFDKIKIDPKVGLRINNLFAGLVTGVVVSFFCGVGYSVYNNLPIDWNKLIQGIHNRLLSNLFPASIEEVVFRYSIVHSAFLLFTEKVALFLGSVPFGLLHLMGAFFGQPVGVMHVIGVSLAGLLLSQFYLEFGLVATIALHLVWNTFALQWSEALNIDIKSGPVQIEGSVSTIIILLITCYLLFLYKHRKKA